MSTIVTLLGTASENMSANISGAVDWSNLNNVLTTDSNYASAAFSSTHLNSNYLYIHGFGLTLPSTAVIEGIEVLVKKLGIGPVADLSAGLIYVDEAEDLTITSPDKAIVGNWTGVPVIVSYGGLNDLWSRTWSIAELTDTAFGFAIAASGDGSTSNSANIEYIELSVAYHQLIDHTPTGGCRMGGSATIQSSTTITPTNGVLVSGHSPEIHNIITFGGVIVSGSAPNAHGLYAYGGATVGSTAPINVSYNPSPVQGCLASGTATHTHHLFGSGGAGLSGSATVVSSFWTEGGAIANSQATSYVGYNIPITSTGLRIAGAAFVDPYLPEGGASGGGSCVVSVKYNTTAAGGAYLATASAEVVNFFAPTDGLLASGQSITAINQNVSGGCAVSGMALVTPYFEVMSGGAILEPFSFVDPYISTGGSAASGSAVVTSIWQTGTLEDEYTFYCTGQHDVPKDLNTTKVAVASVRIDIDANFVSWNIRHSLASGIIRFLGPATETETASPIIYLDGSPNPVIGSTTLSDDAESGLLDGLGYLRLTDDTFGHHIRGQITNKQAVTDGTAAYGLILTEAIGGGAGLGGTALNVLTKTEYAFGGAISGGSAQIGNTIAPISGCGCAGQASIGYFSTPEISSGAIVSGSHAFAITYNITPTNGILVGGQPIISINVAVGGGPTAAGEATVGRVVQPIFGGGGVRLSGTLLLQQTYNGVQVTGGVRIYGKWVFDYLRPLSHSPHIGYALAMKSENILNAAKPPTNVIKTQKAASPIVEENRFNVAQQPGWCNFGESCDSAYLPKIVQKRQGKHLPPKNGRVVVSNDQITKFT